MQGIRDFLRDKTRDNTCVTLADIGLRATLAPRNQTEEKIPGKNFGESLGLITVASSERWKIEGARL